MSIRYFHLVVISAALACASASGASGGHHGTNVITAAQIAATTATNAYEAVEKIRPDFLRSRGTDLSGSDSGLAEVYIGAGRYGDATSLRNIAAGDVSEIRFYKGAEAATKFGMQNPSGINGVIEVTLKH